MNNNYVVESSLGFSVYGTQQYDYTVNGEAGQYFGKAVSSAAMLRAVAVEATLNAYTKAVEMRQQKIVDLGVALGYVSACGTEFKNDDDMDKRYPKKGTDDRLIVAYDIMEKYGVDLSHMHRGYIYHEDVQRNTQTIQYAIDLENTELQEDMSMLQSMTNERDSAYELASEVRKKADKTAENAIGNIR